MRSERLRQRSRPSPSLCQRPSPSSSGDVSRRLVGGIVVVIITCMLLALNRDQLGFSNLSSALWSSTQQPPAFSSVPIVSQRFPHDSAAFLQGLEFDNTLDQPRVLFESTGLYGRSVVRKYDLRSGAILAETRLEREYFGEGLTLCGSELYQLTWRERVLFVYDRDDLRLKRQLSLGHDGWGICHDSDHQRFIVTDGSDYLRFYSQDGFQLQGRIQVKQRIKKDLYRSVNRLNELEYIDGKVWANVWMENRVVVIDPETGLIERQLDLEHIVAEIRQQGYQTDQDAVLNGIAFHQPTRTLIVSGKLWPTLYQINADII